MTYIRLAILDDHKLVRRGFCMILNSISDFNVLLETDKEEEIVELIKNDCPDILLLDISMPETNGLELIPKFLKLNKDLKIIMLTMHKEGEYIIKAVKNGACSYLLKDVEPDELEDAIRSVYEKNKYFSPFISELLIDNISKPKEIGKISER
jgi:DNA-binding NarL/FixJ family response regulator